MEEVHDLEPVSAPEGQGHRERSCWTGMASRGGNGDGFSLEEELGLQVQELPRATDEEPRDWAKPAEPGAPSDAGQQGRSPARGPTLPSPPLLSPQQTWASMTCLGSWK